MPAWPLRMLACAHLERTVSGMLHRVGGQNPLFDANGLNLNESRGVDGLEATELIHRRLVLVVKTLQTNDVRIFSDQRPTEYAPRRMSGPQRQRCPCRASGEQDR